MSPSPHTTSQERMGLSTLEDISHLILQSHDLNETLTNIAQLVASRMRTEVCSIYLCEDESLVLRATVGLSANAVGVTRLSVGEGLVGYTAKTCAVVNVDEPQSDQRFCYVVNSDEEIYHSFLGIPLFDRQNLLGVMAIQTIEKRKFEPVEISTLSTIAFQLSTVVANARLLDRLDEDPLPDLAEKVVEQEMSQPETAKMVRGQLGFGSFAMGPAHVIDGLLGFADIFDDEVTEPAEELAKIERALAAARIETICLEKKIAERLDEGDAAIFHSHLMILQDRVFVEKIERGIYQGLGAVAAVKQVISEYIDAFRKMDDPYLRERGADVEDVGRRLLSQLCGGSASERIEFSQPGIVVADELLASKIALMDLDHVLGLVLQKGDANGHAVIVAKSLGIATLVGAENVLKQVKAGTPVILDAKTRTLHIEPSAALQSEYGRLVQDTDRQAEELQRFVKEPAVTADGHEVTLRANIGLRSDVEVAIQNGAAGVGLYRTELPYMARPNFPDRETQYEIYRYVVEGFAGNSVTIRTLDIGGDKPLSYFEAPQEENPFLGWRSVRVSLDQREVFRDQIEAILMAATHGEVKIMFPMITNLAEVIECKEMVDQSKLKLLDQGWDVPDVPIGMMVETPAAVMMIDQFAPEVDFFSLGTNDLIQYLLAADRGNAKVSHYYESLHPAVLKAISSVVDASKRHGTPLSICGEMVSDPAAFAVLVGLGIEDFSMSSPSILSIKAMLTKQKHGALEELAKRCLTLASGSDVSTLANQWIDSGDGV